MGLRGREVGGKGEGSGEWKWGIRGREGGVRGEGWGMPTPMSTPSIRSCRNHHSGISDPHCKN